MTILVRSTSRQCCPMAGSLREAENTKMSHKELYEIAVFNYMRASTEATAAYWRERLEFHRARM
jgi:hypothetical protein